MLFHEKAVNVLITPKIGDIIWRILARYPMNYRSNYIKNLLLPCLAFSVTTGIFSALLIALFKWAASRIIGLSGQIYAFVRTDPRFFPLLIVAFALLGLIVSFILSYSHSCRGGGIPTSIAAIRGHTSFHWIKSALLLPVSALSTFLCGIPLGNEGPSVQMGAAIGRGAVRLIGSKKDAGWNRYIMTGGAAAGFAAATGAPITAILFSMEEVHRRFSPLLFSVASISVIVSQLISRVLAGFGIGTLGLFHISNLPSLPLESCFIPIAVGLACGICAVFFTRAYNGFDKLIREKLGKVSLRIKLPVIFALTAIIGFFSAEMLGSGHDLVELIFERSFTWYLLVLFFLVRAIMLMVSNTVGVTGGVFLPTLAFGAIIGALLSEAFISLGVLGEEYHVLIVCLGMASFLGATSRVPVMASIFAVEVLGGMSNVLSVIISVTCAFLVIELSGMDDFCDTVIKTKTKSLHAGRTAHTVKVTLTVAEDAFARDKEMRDILWPSSCVLLSIEKGPNHGDGLGIAVLDKLTVHYTTHDPERTADELISLLGTQDEATNAIMRSAK